MTLTGMAAGAAIGAALGLIYSPGTGAENRRRIVEWVNSRVAEAGSNLQSQAERASTWADHRRSAIAQKAQTAATSVQEQVARVVPGNAPAQETGGTQC